MNSVQEGLSSITADDTIIMASAITRLRENTFDSMVKNVRMVDNISRFGEEKGISYFVFLSTVDVYGLVSPATFINERLLPNPNDYYALSKLSGEYLLKKVCSKKHMPLLILRLPGIYGPGNEGKRTINKLVESAMMNKEIVIYGDGQDKRDFVYVEDVCNIIKKAIDQKVNNTLNVATGKSYSINEIVEVIRSYYGEEFNVVYKQRENLHEERVKDMVYDTSFLTALFPDFRFKDIRGGIRAYLKEYSEK